MSSKLLSAVGYNVFINENIITIYGARPVQILSGCNFFEYINVFLFYIISLPSNKKRMLKYIFICLFYLSFIQIFRVASFALYIKYIPEYWGIAHQFSSYLFHYPGIIIIWYLYSRKYNEFELT